MEIQINVPATSANLGPGFDALGLALDLWNKTLITPAKEFGVTVKGEGSDRLASGRNNLLIRAAGRLAERARKPLPPFHADCVNAIPLSSGMGSSSAAILTGLLAANALLENRFSREAILDLASEMEGHPDNVAPALLGGLVVSMMQDEKVIARPIPIGADLHLTVALPDFYLPTKQARAALPKNAVLLRLDGATGAGEAFETAMVSASDAMPALRSRPPAGAGRSRRARDRSSRTRPG